MIKVRELSVTYRETGRLAVGPLSLELSRGERVALLGPSGCGKTTVLRAILGLLPAHEAEIGGEIWTEGARMAAVFQKPSLFPWMSAAENAAFPLRARGGRSPAAIERTVAPLLKMCGLADSADHLPHQLSSGMRQRVSFIRALAASPDVIVMDEPFSSLDVATRDRLMVDFLEILRGRPATLLFVTHSVDEALRMGDRVVVLTSGPARQRVVYDLRSLSPERRAGLKAEVEAHYEA